MDAITRLFHRTEQHPTRDDEQPTAAPTMPNRFAESHGTEVAELELHEDYLRAINAAIESGREELVPDLTESYEAERARLRVA